MDREESTVVPAPSGADPWERDLEPRRVIALLEPLVGEERRVRILSVLAGRLDGVTAVLDAPHDPHNGAAVIRSCDAFGLTRLHVVERTEGFLVASGVTKGTDRWVEVIRHRRDADVVAALAASGHDLVATHPDGVLEPEDLASFDRVALLLGNEHGGLSPGLAVAARTSVRIPMRGFVESLNVSVAAAILLRAATRGRAGDLSADRHERLYARGLYRSVPRAAEVLSGLSARAPE